MIQKVPVSQGRPLQEIRALAVRGARASANHRPMEQGVYLLVSNESRLATKDSVGARLNFVLWKCDLQHRIILRYIID
jgi:hypothetical protein